MFEASFLTTGGICEFRDENLQIDEGGASALVTFRILDVERWKSMVSVLLQEIKKYTNTFGITVRKEFFLQDTDVKFTWAIYIWGQDESALEDAVDALKPYLGAMRKKTPIGQDKPASATHSVSAVASRGAPQLIRKSFISTGEGTIETGIIPLPHRSPADRNTVPAGQRTVTLSGGEVFDPTRKPRVHVSGLTSHGGGAAIGDQEL